VGIYPPEQLDDEASPWDAVPSPALEIGVGHPERSFVVWLGPGGGLGVEPAAPPWPEDAPAIGFDYGGDAVFINADRGRVTPAAAREAAREFVRTGRRPTCIEWADQ
jgi:hypothetical protein